MIGGVILDDLSDKIDEWRCDWSIDVPLHQYLGWEYSDYVRWVETGELPIVDRVSPRFPKALKE